MILYGYVAIYKVIHLVTRKSNTEFKTVGQFLKEILSLQKAQRNRKLNHKFV